MISRPPAAPRSPWPAGSGPAPASPQRRMPGGPRRSEPARAALALLVCCALPLCLGGCIKLSARSVRQSSTPVPRAQPAPPRAETPKQDAAPLEAQAYPLFDALRTDLLEANPGIETSNCAFVMGIDVSKSAYDSQVIEYTTRILADCASFFFAPGDKVVVVPWDSQIRGDHVQQFDFTDAKAGDRGLNAAFESVLKLVRPESRGSNLLDARGYCMERAVKLQQDSRGQLRGVVLVFTDIRVPDGKLGDGYTQEQLTDLRTQLAGSSTEDFDARLYTVERTRIWCHALSGKTPEGAAPVAGLNRRRSTAAVTPRPAPQAPLPVRTTPTPRKDPSGTRVLLMLLSLAALVALIALPFTWQHRLAIGGSHERLRAIGGRVVIRAAEGISPPGEFYLRLPDTESRPLVALEGKGPSLVARAARGVRLNEGRTELAIPSGKAVTLRLVVEGVAGEQTVDMQLTDFWSANSGQIIGMGIAFIVLLASIIG